MKKFSGIVAWYSADRIPGISISLIVILNCNISLVFETEMLNWTANEESLWRVSRFFIYSRFVVLAAGDFVYAKFSEINVIIRPSWIAIFTVKCNDSVSFSFFFPCVAFKILFHFLHIDSYQTMLIYGPISYAEVAKWTYIIVACLEGIK